MIYFTSDTHFGHENVIRFAGCPYETVAQMNHALVSNINARVLPRDELYILGFFRFGSRLRTPRQFASRSGASASILSRAITTRIGTQRGWRAHLT